MVRNKCYSILRSIKLYCKRGSNKFPVRGNDKGGRCNRDNRYRKRNRLLIYYYLFVCVLPVNAEEPRVQNTSNPVAAATGNVTNQAVQIQNNGAPSRQYNFQGNSCNGSTMVFTPFVMGNNTTPVDPHARVLRSTGDYN